MPWIILIVCGSVGGAVVASHQRRHRKRLASMQRHPAGKGL
jgi:hypothetical protein